MKAVTRVGASFCLSVFSIVSVILLLPSSRVSTQLQKIALGTTLDDFPALWNWDSAADEYEADGVALVVFGDSWVDDSEDGEKGRERSWAEALCGEINCTTYLNFAASPPLDSYPSSAPTGAITSHSIFTLSPLLEPLLEPLAAKRLPDLAAQIQEFLALPLPTPEPRETLFLVSFGFWDIYSFAGLDYELGKDATAKAVNELFNQLNILHAHYSDSLSAAHIVDEPANSLTNNTEVSRSNRTFRVIIPKVFEPTMLPGWLSQRPVPLPPSSVAEHQKNAIHLAAYWNTLVEDRISTWLNEAPPPPVDLKNITTEELASLPVIEKDVYYYDLPQHLLDIIIEHQLEDGGLSDASGLGNGQSPFESVYDPCVREGTQGTLDGLVDLNGLLVCKEPEEYLFWDSFNLGGVVKESIGKEVGAIVQHGKSMRKIWAGADRAGGL